MYELIKKLKTCTLTHAARYIQNDLYMIVCKSQKAVVDRRVYMENILCNMNFERHTLQDT